MTFSFLCPGHKQAFLGKPEAAKEYWLHAIDRLYSQQPEANAHCLHLAGSALEASELFFESGSRVCQDSVERYKTTVLELFTQLVELRQTPQAVMLLARASSRIEGLVAEGLDLTLVLRLIEDLMCEGRRVMLRRRPLQGVTKPLGHRRLTYSCDSRARECANSP